jgi:hypothetical protein
MEQDKIELAQRGYWLNLLLTTAVLIKYFIKEKER